MDRAERIADLVRLQHCAHELVAALPNHHVNRQFDPDLSPIGWHIGHCAVVERFWVLETVLEEAADSELHSLYFPEFTEKSARGPRLPARDALLAWAARSHRETIAVLAEPRLRARAHPLMHDDYLLAFLQQHYAQHLETMRYVLARRAHVHHVPPDTGPLTPRAPCGVRIELPAGRYRIGTTIIDAYDNERPTHEVELRAAWLAAHPISNAEFAGFMADDGYQRNTLWTARGWQWRCDKRIEHPAGWCRSQYGHWYGVGPDGAHRLDPDTAIKGLSWFEADAFARWAGARLPHEYEWEAATRAGLLAGSGQAWEWCANTLHPYPGFRAFPYDGYSLPWCDGNHYVLRGASTATERAVRRPTFRNFFEPDKRYQFAGLRLAWDWSS